MVNPTLGSMNSDEPFSMEKPESNPETALQSVSEFDHTFRNVLSPFFQLTDLNLAVTRRCKWGTVLR